MSDIRITKVKSLFEDLKTHLSAFNLLESTELDEYLTESCLPDGESFSREVWHVLASLKSVINALEQWDISRYENKKTEQS